MNIEDFDTEYRILGTNGFLVGLGVVDKKALNESLEVFKPIWGPLEVQKRLISKWETE